ncbi:hypothetical protein SAPIO_CDS0998 [Scedosporium apiospermum]|uniref:Adenylosuccinate lyase n=1 Tax=Pseudallescheria apiosperma TaxID=563466 RepID=A0A084GFM4_PSEDA|nr:uncharacterized protein SAPIO_CDS0998 [Scedosporium apiospermum]KEZ46136.1 hypothetical protein SAPIO_CDS0998 [Scedosporium apiospermum]
MANVTPASTGASPYDSYQTSLTTRYCSPTMSQLFSQRSRHSTWRKLWLSLAESEKELGVGTITDEALEQMRAHLTVTDEDFEIARVEEKRRRHDVMAHVHAFGAVAPAAAGIIHLGATSCFVTDNTELILAREAMDLICKKIAKVIANLSAFALRWKSEPTLAYTHLQAAQLITVGKRAAQWILDLMLDLHAIEQVRQELKFRGAQGTTGTQASFLSIFEGDASKCDQLNELLCQKFGFPSCYDISTQTYTRKVDLIIANAVAGLGSTAQKITGDIRHLMHWKEIEEPFESSQIGSSAMAYKRNPFGSRIDEQAVIASRVAAELPFMVTEEIIMRLCAKGVSRQDAHEEIRVLSHQAGAVVKQEGKPNDLVERIKANEFFKPIWGELDGMLKAELYTGRSSQIVEKYCGPGGPVSKALAPYADYIRNATTAKLNV